jgi:cell filamentation protein
MKFNQPRWQDNPGMHGNMFPEYPEFNANRILSMKIIKDWHRRLFWNIFPFAGNYRSVELNKGKDFTEYAMTWRLDFLNGIPDLEKLIQSVDQIEIHDPITLSLKISEIICEFLFIHPFREGNGRISRLIGDYLLAKNNFPPVGANLKVDGNEYIRRLHLGYNKKDYKPMSELISEKLNKIMRS